MMTRLVAIGYMAIVALSSSAQALDVQRFTVPGPGSVNTWWVDAPAGVIVVDFQRDTDAAAQAITAIRATGRPVVAMLLTHAHPDHIGGIDQFRRAFPGVPVMATAAAIGEIRSDGAGYQAKSRDALEDKLPRYVAPDRMVRDGEQLTLGGLTVVVHDLGPSEGNDMTAYVLPAQQIMFSGDIAVAGKTDFLLEKRTAVWLRQIDAAERAFTDIHMAYPGHGTAANPAVLYRAERQTLVTYRAAVARRRASDGTLDAPATQAAVKEVERKLGKHDPVALLPDLVRLNVEAVAAETARPD